MGDKGQVSPGYRPEIDGLRAIAVTAVVLCHAGVPALAGGYVGVDIFFVISGFLITRLLLVDLQKNLFNLSNFYERRCRRILPPLIIMAILVALFGGFFLTPLDFRDLSRSMVAAATFWANIFFYQESGYWDTAAYLKPLLHTWSLSVEEQFYLLYPLLLAFLYKNFKSRMTLAILTLALVSLFFSSALIKTSPSMVFYRLPFRAWELLLGALTALTHQFSVFNRSALLSLSLVGLGFLAYPIFSYDSKTVFPALNALLPCLGTAILIYIHADGLGKSPVGKMLGARPLAALGKISYGLYLWHWPMLVLPGLSSLTPITWSEKTIWLSLAVILSVCSFFFVEQPVRQKKVFKERKRLFIVALCSIVFLAVAGRFVRYTEGSVGGWAYDDKLWKMAATFAASRADHWPHNQIENFMGRDLNKALQPYPVGARKNKPDFFVWGDSHAGNWLPLIDALGQEYGLAGLSLAYTGCSPWSLNPDDAPSPICGKIRSYLSDLISKKQIKNLIIAMNYPDYSKNGVFPDQFVETINELQRYGLKIWIIEPAPVYPYRIPEYLENAVLQGASRSESLPVEIKGGLLSVLRSAAENDVETRLVKDQRIEVDNAQFLSFSPPICSGERCLIADNQGAFYNDTNHLSIHGVFYFQDTLRPAFIKIRELF